MYRTLNNLYGQLRGFRRASIRREVDKNAGAAADQLAAKARRMLAARLADALERFPAYAAKVREAIGRLPDTATDIDLASLPVWTRRDQKDLFAAGEYELPPGSFVHSTGGSTGAPLRFHVTRESYEWRRAVSDRGYSWARAEEGQSSFYVWAMPVFTRSKSSRLKTSLHHRLQRRTYFDSFSFGTEQKQACCEAIDGNKPRAIVGYAGNLVELARYARDNDALRWRSETVVTAAEGLHPGQREFLQKWLGKEVFLSYGSREFMLIGMECSRHCGYHVSSDNLLVEVVDDQGQPAAEGETGRILVTDLHNSATPFIRYETGDLGTGMGGNCDCGMPFPLLATVDGRTQEVIYGADGRKLSALFMPHLLKEFPWIEGYQVEQHEKKAVQVNIITPADITPARAGPVTAKLQERLGEDTEIVLNRVTDLVRNRSGKTPIVLSDISAE